MYRTEYLISSTLELVARSRAKHEKACLVVVAESPELELSAWGIIVQELQELPTRKSPAR